jgi:hypothetical protein
MGGCGLLRLRIIAAVLAFAALAAGCGSAPAKPPTISDVAAAQHLHACKVWPASQRTLFTRSEGECRDQGGRLLDVAAFNSNEARDNWVSFVSQTGGEIAFKGDRYAAWVE